MIAAVLTGPETIQVQNLPDPQPKPGEVRVRVRYCGVCGSDIPRVFAGAAHNYPIVLGHEFSGTIDCVGESVPAERVGENVACAPLLPCFVCADCQQGRPAQCAHYSFIGSRQNGAMAQYVCMPARNAVPCGDTPFPVAALTEPSTVALHGLMHMGLKAGGRVAVVGAGTIGLLAVAWAKFLGSASVTAFDIEPQRLAAARELGADAAFLSSDEAEAMAAADGRGYDAVVETAGAGPAMAMCFRLAARRGQVCFIGTSSRDLSFDWKTFELMNRKEFTLTGSWMSYSAPFPGREWSLACDMAAQGRLVVPKKLIGRILPLHKAMEAFALARSGAAGGRVMLEIP